MKTIFLIVGRTGSGKDTLTNLVAKQNNLKILKSYATRPPRVGEKDTHIFIKPDEVEQYRQDFCAYTKIGDFEYFSTMSQLKDIDFYIIDIEGVNYLKSKNIPNIKFIVIYIDLSYEIRKYRAVNIRLDNLKTFEDRCLAENEQFNYLENNLMYDYRITNLVLETSACLLNDIVQKERE